MQSKASTVKEYIASLPSDRVDSVEKIRKIINANIPSGFTEVMQYGMIGRVVPHSIYPAGYHCKPTDPLPFLGLASQKNAISLYHMGIYVDQKLLERFQMQFPKYAKKKLDMGKSCIRFTDINDIPYALIGTLVKKISVKQRIALYEKKLK